MFVSRLRTDEQVEHPVKLPSLILDAQPANALQMLAYASNPRVTSVEFDARDLIAIEPVGVCLFASAVRRARVAAKSVVIRNACPTLHRLLESVKDDVRWANSKVNSPLTMRSTLAMAIATQAEANAMTNRLSAALASFVPLEDRQAMEDQHGLRIYHAVQPALAYVLTELVDNVFLHSRTIDFPNPTAWLATQWYVHGDLVRVAVVDDGCGLLGSLRGLSDPPANHFDAARVAFRPFVSSKGGPAIYTHSRQMGLGLSVCRDICQRLQGQIYAASGNARVLNPGLNDENGEKLEPFYRGTIISLQFHRRAATTRTLPEILERYLGSPHLRARLE